MERDYSDNHKLCLTKALLVFLSEEKTLCGGFNLYKNYIQSFVLTEPDTNIVSNQRRPSLELSAISSFYKFTNHTEDPAFFNFFNFNVQH